VRTSEAQTFEREPGRTADPSALLGMTKDRMDCCNRYVTELNQSWGIRYAYVVSRNWEPRV
jgi:hypothetical protein